MRTHGVYLLGLSLSLFNLGGLGSAAAAAPELKPKSGLKPFEFMEAPERLPNYVAGAKWGTQAAPITTMQKPLDPAESAQHLIVPAGFTANLWAAEPDILKPICMAWDARGRLWIAETVDYPNELQQPGEGRDRIKICEDTDGDGRADKFTIFADKLSIPTGMVFANGGVIIIQAGETLFLKDTDGDDRAEVRQVLFRGWGTGDTHATANNLRWGFDNWIWGTVGYSGFDGDVGGKRVKFNMGVYRFKPDGSALEFIKSSNNNTWGLGLSEEGIVFGSTANNNASWYMPIPNRYYEAVNGWSPSRMETIADSQAFYPITEKVRQVDAHGRYTAGAGHALYTARSFPREYWNRVAFVTEPTGHLIGQFRLEAAGADFVAHNEHSFLASDDEWTAPIMAEVGPDGALWVIDWYNYIVQHNPTPIGFQTGKGNAYETSLRDKRHGRIYRVVHGASTPTVALKLAGAAPAQLVAALKNDNQLWRLHAQRLLVERGQKDVQPALLALVRDPAVDELGLNLPAIHALWTLHGLGANAGAAEALTHRSAGVRRAAVMTLPRTAGAREALLKAKLVADPDAQVRLAALLALADLPPSEAAGVAAFAVLQDERNANDRWIPHAATAAGARNDAGFLKAALAGKTLPTAAGTAVRLVTGHYAQRGPVESVVPTLLALNGAAPAVALPLLDGLASTWPREKVPMLSAADESRLVALLKSLPAEAGSALLALADRWGRRSLFVNEIPGIRQVLAAQVASAGARDEQRTDAARRLVPLDDTAATVQLVLAQISPLAPPALVTGFIGALGESRQGPTGTALLGALPKFSPAARRAALTTLLRRAEWAQSLLDALERRELQRGDLGGDHWAQLKSHSDKAVAARARELEKAAGVASNPDMEAVVKKLLPIAQQPGDVARGREVFTTTCAVCHTFNGQGAKIGPDLTGVGARARADILVDIIDPNRSVEANYRLWTVKTKTGEDYAGRLDTESATAIEILDTTSQKHTVQRKDIASLEVSNLSIMPVGFDQLPATDLASLLEFLATGSPEPAKK